MHVFWDIIIKAAIAIGRPIIGVCRGAQALCVHHGGSLWQHSAPRVQSHSIATIDGKVFKKAEAGHHQIMKPVGHYQLVGWNPEMTLCYTSDTENIPVRNCAEIVYYPNTRCLAIQPHPEWEKEKTDFVLWLNQYIKKLNIDYEF